MIEILYNSLMLASLFAVAVCSVQISALHDRMANERGLRTFIKSLKFSKIVRRVKRRNARNDSATTMQLSSTESCHDSTDPPPIDPSSYTSLPDFIESDPDSEDSAEIPFIDDDYTDEECRWLSEYGWTTDEVLNIKPLSREEIKPTQELLKFRRNRRSLDRAAMLQQMTLALQSAPIVPYAQ